MIAGLAWVDAAMLVVLGLSTLVGVFRGVVAEASSAVSLVVAWLVAPLLMPLLAPWVEVGEPGSRWHTTALFAVAFAAAWLVWWLLAKLLRAAVAAAGLGGLDRALGAVFGAVRGVLILVVVALAVSFTPAASSADWQQAQGPAWLQVALDLVLPWLPASWSQLVRH